MLYDIADQCSSSQKPILFLIDEIENHLHPALLARFLNQIRDFLPPFAMLLATTHSPQVVVASPPNSRVLLVHSTELASSKARNQILVSSNDAGAARMLYELYGAESAEAAAHLQRDLDSAVKGELLAYAQENLRESHAFAGSAPADPQRTFLTGLIHAVRPLGRPLRVLDIGAGQGRLIKGLQADLRSGSNLELRFDAVEPSAEYRIRLRSLETESGVGVQDIYASAQDIPTETSYDLVLLHNVIHEIPATELVDTITSCIAKLPTLGVVNILEQAVLPQGERRYFVFSATALSRAFQALRFEVLASNRTSRSGVPIYEITAKRIDSSVITHELVSSALLVAIEETIADNLGRYCALSAEVSKPVEFAFLAFNIVNGNLARTQISSKVGTYDG